MCFFQFKPYFFYLLKQKCSHKVIWNYINMHFCASINIKDDTCVTWNKIRYSEKKSFEFKYMYMYLTHLCMCCGIGLLECLLLTYISNWFWSFDLVVSFLTLYWVTRVLSTVPWSFTAFSCYTCFYFYMYINPHLYIKM